MEKVRFFDGGMGSLLQSRGLKPGEIPDTWSLSHADDIVDIHLSYINAGAQYILTDTFGTNRYKFSHEKMTEIIHAAVANVHKAIELSGRDDVKTVLDIGSLGKLLKPLGTLDYEEAIAAYGEIAKIGEEAGADMVLIETMNDAYEVKAAVIGVKENCNLPVFVTVVFDEKAKMMTGANPRDIVATLEGLRVDAIGINCSLGPKQMLPIFEEMAKYASLPLIVNPNAGLPREEGGKTVYDVGPEEFATYMEEFVKLGARYIGGCCGTTPDYIRATYEHCKDIPLKPLEFKEDTIVSSGMQSVVLGGKSVIIGERINPTGKSKFKQALRDGDIDYILKEGDKQVEAGAHLLDVNVGLPEIDEVAMMKKVVYELQSIFSLPLQIDTTDPVALEAAVRLYNGKPMINSVNGKQHVMDEVFPIVAKYGGVLVGLTIDEDGIPETADGRVAIAMKIYEEAKKYGIDKKDIVIDCLTMTMSTNTNSANVTLEAVNRIHKMGGRTVLGVSNISFGLPQRELVNSNFYGLALENGLSAGIINPMSQAMMRVYDVYAMLRGYDENCMDYVSKYTLTKEQQEAMKAAEGAVVVKKSDSTSSSGNTLKDSIIKGMKDEAYKATKEKLADTDALEIINEELVPALDEVGKGFAGGTLFLPQLLMSAEAASNGFTAIKEHLDESGEKSEKKYPIVIATVKGDIHDIGKNIVKVLLENYSYDVHDLGKDVAPELIVEEVIKTHAPLCGLSALMTTTVVSMEETIKLLREKAPWCKVMVGGAVLTQEYADMIGADFYGRDAMESVNYAQKLYEEMNA